MKYLKYILIGLLVFTINFNSVTGATKSKTLGQARQELKELKEKYANINVKKATTKAEIKVTEANIAKSQLEIEENRNTINKAKVEIEKLNIDMAKTAENLKSQIASSQVTKGENIYLEYIFNSKSYADLVYRYAVAEQVASHENKKINDWEIKKEESQELKNKLEQAEKELVKKIDYLDGELLKLDGQLGYFDEAAVDIQTDIKSAQELIDRLSALGCREDQDMDECMRVNGTSYARFPLVRGVVTSEFGKRVDPISKEPEVFHSGIDLGGNPEGTNVYPIADGTVGKILYKQSCGGNMVYVYHTINGVKYTSVYMHLLQIKVQLNDQLTSSSIVGTVGGGSGTKSYEKCSDGAHLHLSIAEGWYGRTYISYSTYRANLINPRDVVSFPAKGRYWSSR